MQHNESSASNLNKLQEATKALFNVLRPRVDQG